MTEDLEPAQTQYQAGKYAFERGQYRQSVERLEQAVNLAGPDTRLGGEVQLWLVSAYQAAGESLRAIALCEQLARHPDLRTRKQSRRLVYILKAPKLRLKPEWMTQIPDLSGLEDGDGQNQGTSRFAASTPRPAARPRPASPPEPIDLSQVNTKENGFVWVALGAIALLLLGWFWWG
jgi:tetratricopeptide (TPR) repeat protein